MSSLAAKENSPHLSRNPELILAQLSELPPFSPVVTQLLKYLGNQDFTFRDLSGLVEQDTVLAGNVLRMANSAAFGRRVEILAISKAVSILGINRLRNLVLSLSVANMWRSVKVDNHLSLERFNAHALATAILCDGIAQRSNLRFPEGAFLSGLLHDVGKLLIAMASPEAFLQVLSEVIRTDCTPLEAERAVLGLDHAELSAQALAAWKLPEALQRAVRDHHRPVKGELSMVVAVADECANGLGFSIMTAEHPEVADVQVCGPLLATIGLEAKAEKIFAEFRIEYDTVRSLR